MEATVKYTTGKLLPLCPWCGAQGKVYRAARVWGRARIESGVSGEKMHHIVERDTLVFAPHSDWLRCSRCKHVRRDVRLVDGGQRVEALQTIEEMTLEELRQETRQFEHAQELADEGM